jgi:hypothetical protein
MKIVLFILFFLDNIKHFLYISINISTRQYKAFYKPPCPAWLYSQVYNRHIYIKDIFCLSFIDERSEAAAVLARTWLSE